ncbi:hypothetical protein WN51_00494, partial [Melipona quadrifasciata]
FHLFIDDEVINCIILYTNTKAKGCMQSEKQWKPVDRMEIDAFLGLLRLIGRYRESKECKYDLWKDNALSRRFYAATMSRDRFVDILRYVRFDDHRTHEERKADDKLAPLRDVTNVFVKNCKDCYNTTETGYVNEQLVTFRLIRTSIYYKLDKFVQSSSALHPYFVTSSPRKIDVSFTKTINQNTVESSINETPLSE